MAGALIATAGQGYFIAVMTVFLAALVAKAGSARAPSEEPRRRSAPMLLLDVITGLTPVLLVLYAFAVTTDQADPTMRVLLMVLPIIVGFCGALAGAILNLAAHEARTMFRMASIVSGMAAFIVTVGAIITGLDTAQLQAAADALMR